MERWRQDPRLRYYAASLLIALVTNRILFPLGHALGQLFPHRDLSLPSEPLLPFLPWTIVIYVGVFAWWGYVFYLVSQRDRREGDRLFAADLLAKLVCLAFFVFLPTSVTRPAVTGGSLWEAAVRCSRGLVSRFISSRVTSVNTASITTATSTMMRVSWRV